MTDINFDNYDPQALQTVVVNYLETHAAKEHEKSEALFAPDATIVDNGETFKDGKAFSEFLKSVDKEYKTTIDWTKQNVIDQTRVDVLSHVVGNFPGGEADIWYRFTLDDDRITRLVIGL